MQDSITTTRSVPVRINGGGFLTYNFAEFGECAQIFDWCVVLRPEMIQIKPHVRIDSFCKLEGGNGIIICQYVHVSSYCHLNIGGGSILVGEYAGIASGARILGGTNTPLGMSMSAAAPHEMQVVERGHTVISAYAFVGAGAIIMPEVTLGIGAVAGAGAVVTKNIPDWEIWAGNPAHKIGERPHPPRKPGGRPRHVEE